MPVLLLILAGVGWWGYRSSQRHEALRLTAEGRFEEATPLLEQALSRSRNDVEVLTALARGYREDKNFPNALRHLDTWCLLRPDDPEARHLRLEVHREMQQFNLALLDGLHLLQLDSTDDKLLIQVAGLAFSAGDFDQAETLCKQALQSAPRHRDVRRLLAQTLRSKGLPKDAATLYDQLLGEDASDTAALLGRGSLAIEMGDPNRAIPLLEKVLVLDPRRQRTGRYQLSLAYERAGRTEDALRVRAEVRKMQEAETMRLSLPNRPDDLAFRVRTAAALLDNGNTGEALDLLGQVLVSDSKFQPAHAVLAGYYEKQGEKARARTHRKLAGNAD